MSKVAKNRVKSTWTPLSNQEANSQIFEERRELVGKWFDKWNDEQRRRVLEDLLSKCKIRQIEFAGNLVNKKKPIYHDDFTRALPRVLSLYIFSFLDPRSLCRAGQVCWYWKYLTELDQLWMTKCVRLGWVLSFTPNPYETGVWKRNYIENILALQCLRPASQMDVPATEIERLRLELAERHKKGTPRPGSGRRPPWRGSDPVPKDTWRNNYLENDDEIEKVNKLRKQGLYGPESGEITKRAKTKLNTGHHQQISTKKTLKPKMIPGMAPYNGERPEWAKAVSSPESPPPAAMPYTPTAHHAFRAVPASPEASVAQDASQRPQPVQHIKVVKTVPSRTPRDPPSQNLFPDRPWKVPDGDEYDSDT